MKRHAQRGKWLVVLALTGCNSVLGIGNPESTASRPDGGEDASVAEGGPPVCTTPAVACGERCVDLLADPESCGTCGHSCAGGACASGVCQPLVLASNLEQGQALFVDEEFVYYLATAGSASQVLSRISKRGPPCVGADSRCILSVPTSLWPAGVQPLFAAANRDTVYLSASSRPVVRFTKADQSWSSFISTSTTVSAMAASDQSLYLAVPHDDYLRRVDTGGGTLLAVGACDGCDTQVGRIAADGTSVWVLVVDGNPPMKPGLHRFPARGTGACRDAECHQPLDGFVRNFVVSGGWLYVATSDLVPESTVRLMRRPLETPCTAAGCYEVIATKLPVYLGVGLLVDGHHVYWTSRERDRVYAIRRLPLGETCPPPESGPCGQVVLGEYAAIPRIADDADAVYALAVDGATLDTRLVKKAK